VNPPLDLDDAPERSVRAVLALGTNLGDRAAVLRSAVLDLSGFEGVEIRAISPVIETRPVGEVEQPDFLNAVVLLRTTLSPLELLAVCHEIEEEHGRVRSVRWAARTLDLDIICYDDVIARSRQLQLPHPRAA
jgi:2-amino-4-hydroxy-6-hydroxymethyldihydropteridine diphosphokinase